MKRNIGNTDRIIRIIAGLTIIAIGFHFSSWWGIIGLVPISTAVVRFCPMYIPFGLSSCNENKTNQ